MQTEALKYISESRLQELQKSVPENRERYTSGNFADLAIDNGWEIESKLVQVDVAALSALNGTSRTAQADADNSLIVYQALKGMTPALAMEERVWTRLTHVECLEYTRARWLPKASDNEGFDKGILLHFFARGLNGVRDDNAISRLWWNMHIATILSPTSPESALRQILRVADVRMNLVERSWTGARLPLSRAIVRMLEKETWLTTDQENFRALMKALNREAGGILFEALSETEADHMVEVCIQKAKNDRLSA